MRQSDGRVHFSDLKAMAETPAHYRHQVEVGREDSPSLSLGRLVHALVLDRAPKRTFVAVYPGPVRRGREYEAWLAAQVPDTEIATRADFDSAHAIATAIRLDRLAMETINREHHELYIEWEWCGLPCAGTVDAYGSGMLVELKTTAKSAGPSAFPWEVRRYGYLAQLAWYRTALQLSGRPVDEVRIVAISTKAPHIPAVYRLSESELEMGERICRTWAERLAQCVCAGSWPGYSESPMELGLADEFDFLSAE